MSEDTETLDLGTCCCGKFPWYLVGSQNVYGSCACGVLAADTLSEQMSSTKAMREGMCTMLRERRT